MLTCEKSWAGVAELADAPDSKSFSTLFPSLLVCVEAVCLREVAAKIIVESCEVLLWVFESELSQLNPHRTYSPEPTPPHTRLLCAFFSNDDAIQVKPVGIACGKPARRTRKIVTFDFSTVTASEWAKAGH
jgi:hypothetical protein